MKALSNLELLFTPENENDAVNKKYVDEHCPDIDFSGVTPNEILISLDDHSIQSTEVPVSDLIYGKDEELVDADIKNLIDTLTLGGYTVAQIINMAVEAAKESVKLDKVTNDKQVKAREDSEVTLGNIAIWSSDGSIIKDGGVSVKVSVPEDAVFTDTTYDEATKDESGLLSATDKDKLDKLDIYNKIFFFNSIEDMGDYDMSDYPYDYAYGIVNTNQYRWRSDNLESDTLGKWRIVTEIVGDLIDIQNFQITDDGYLTVDIIQKDVSGVVLGTSTETIQKISPLPKDKYKDDQTYYFLDMVYHNEILWMCKKPSVSGIKPSGATLDTWMQCSEPNKSNYDLYVENTSDSTIMTYEEWAESLKGKDGEDGESGTTILDAYIDDEGKLIVHTKELDGTENDLTFGVVRGKSAYEIAVDEGFEGTQDEWLDSLKGETIATKLQKICNINGILFDATQDIKNVVTCVTEPDEPIKQIAVNNFIADSAILYILFSKGNTCENISIKVNDKTPFDVYYKNKPFNAKNISAGTVLNLVSNVNRFEVVGNGIDTDVVQSMIDGKVSSSFEWVEII